MSRFRYVIFCLAFLTANAAFADKLVPALSTIPEPAPIPYKSGDRQINSIVLADQQPNIKGVMPAPPTISNLSQQAQQIPCPNLEKLISESNLVTAARFTGEEIELPRQTSESGLFSVRQLLVFDEPVAVKGTAPSRIYVAPVRSFKFEKGMKYLLVLRETKLRSKTKEKLNLKTDSVFVLRMDSHTLIK